MNEWALTFSIVPITKLRHLNLLPAHICLVNEGDLGKALDVGDMSGGPDRLGRGCRDRKGHAEVDREDQCGEHPGGRHDMFGPSGGGEDVALCHDESEPRKIKKKEPVLSRTLFQSQPRLSSHKRKKVINQLIYLCLPTYQGGMRTRVNVVALLINHHIISFSHAPICGAAPTHRSSAEKRAIRRVLRDLSVINGFFRTYISLRRDEDRSSTRLVQVIPPHWH